MNSGAAPSALAWTQSTFRTVLRPAASRVRINDKAPNQTSQRSSRRAHLFQDFHISAAGASSCEDLNSEMRRSRRQARALSVPSMPFQCTSQQKVPRILSRESFRNLVILRETTAREGPNSSRMTNTLVAGKVWYLQPTRQDQEPGGRAKGAARRKAAPLTI